ncbi:MAG: UDP-N-acetylmuramoyl-L-alanyl-D-glutamate--2,6-diaminopimelate ligase, partial [Clostridia bacterium]|nr:UDP-N-acetylmuramoyl-L-alanyl-D-glutamate--2,6-diaminopimelate ligase [Clostridia bacterium]
MIINDILEGTKEGNAEIITVVDRSEAIAKAISIAKKGDTILLAGKGHETYQVIGKERVHYDEREVVFSVVKI